MLKLEYLKILIFFLVSIFIVSLLVFLSIFLNKNISKTSTKKPVECGSHSFGSGKNKIEINFYIITILFVVFEVELVVLVPWILFWKINLKYSGIYIFGFILMLIIGFIFEACRGLFNFKKFNNDLIDSDFNNDSFIEWIFELENRVAEKVFTAYMSVYFIFNSIFINLKKIYDFLKFIFLFIYKSADNSKFKCNLFTVIRNCF